MKKAYLIKNSLLLSSLLLSTLFFHTGCAEKISPLQHETTYHEPIRETESITYEEVPKQYEVHEQYETYETVESDYTQEERVSESYDSYQVEEETLTSTYSEPIHSDQNIETSMVEEPSYSPSQNLPQSSGTAQQLQTVQGGTLSVEQRGNSLSFPQYQDRVILLQIFGKECHFCFEEMPIIQRAKEKYGSRLQIIAIQGEERMSQETATRLIRKFNMNYPIVERDEARELLVFIGETFNWTGTLPFIQLIKNGVTEYTFSNGGVSYNELTESIDTIL